MITKDLYCKGNMQSPNPIENPDRVRVRLIAGEGKVLTIDNENFYSCIDADSVEGWTEVDPPPELSDENVPVEEQLQPFKEYLDAQFSTVMEENVPAVG